MLHVTAGALDGVTVVSARGPCDAHSLQEHLEEALAAIPRGDLVVIDLADVVFVDSGGVEHFVNWMAETAEGRSVRLAAPHLSARTVVSAVAAASGVEVYASVQEAATRNVVDLNDESGGEEGRDSERRASERRAPEEMSSGP